MGSGARIFFSLHTGLLVHQQVPQASSPALLPLSAPFSLSALKIKCEFWFIEIIGMENKKPY